MKKIIVVAIVLIIVFGCSMIPMFFNDDKMLNGTFECINEYGEKSIIKISKDGVYLENIDYNSCEEIAALGIYAKEVSDDDSVVHEYDKSTYDQGKERQEEIKNELDYKEVFDKKIRPISYIQYNDDKTQCSFTVSESVNDEVGIIIDMDIKNKICKIFPDTKSAYKYVK